MTHADDLVDRYLKRRTDAGRMLLTDPFYKAQMTSLRRLLAILDMALEDNDIPVDVRERVLRTTLYGCAPSEIEAELRILDRQKLTEVFSTMVPSAQIHDMLPPVPDTPGPVCRACVLGGCPTHPGDTFGYRDGASR